MRQFEQDESLFVVFIESVKLKRKRLDDMPVRGLHHLHP